MGELTSAKHPLPPSKVGKSMIIPAGWSNPGDAGDFALLFVVERTSSEHFMFAVSPRTFFFITLEPRIEGHRFVRDSAQRATRGCLVGF